MNSILKDEQTKINRRLKIFYGVIIIICIISIIVAVIFQIKKDHEEELNIPEISEEELNSYKTEFNNIFENKVNYLENNSYRITKLKKEEEIVYTGYEVQEQQVNDYELDVKIPYINIQNEKIQEFNQEIKDLFESKAKSILNSQNNDTIYTVSYSAYVSNNILSLVVKSTLKEGIIPQKNMVKTYNYDLTNQKEYTLQEMLEYREITEKEANQEIKQEIKRVQNMVSQLGEVGYSVYSRDIESDIYEVQNVAEYFIGENSAIYIIFAYGNENNTTEMDLIVI